MAHVVVSSALAFQKTKDDDPKMPDGAEVIVKKGGKVPSWVSLFVISALESAGNIVPVGDDQMPEVDSVGPLAPIPTAPVQPPDQPPTFFPLAADEPDDEDDRGPEAPAAVTSVQPKASDRREVWEAYAMSPGVGMTKEEAEAFPNKTDLIEAVEARKAK